MELRITERTFGLEMEYADMVKSVVYMPSGWTWDEEEVITNTDGTRGTFRGSIGGEINTAPMRLCQSDRATLKSVVESINKSNAKVSRDNGIDVHIYVGDLECEELKRIFLLSYWATPVLRKMCKQAVYADDQRYYPAPDLAHYIALCKARNFEGLRNVFEDNSKKGYARYFVNIASYFVRGTVEFRCFNATKDWEELQTCILFAYRFVDYALTHTEDDFKKLQTVEQFCKEVKVKDNLPNIESAPIYFSSVASLNSGHTMHKAVSLNSQLVRTLCDNTSGIISCVNPQVFSLESRLSNIKEKVRIYNNDEFNHVIYRLAKGDLTLSLTGEAEHLSPFISDDPVDQIAVVLVLVRIAKFFQDGEYYRNELESILSGLETSIESARNAAKNLIATLEKADYRLGTLNDAIADGGDIFFNFEDYSKARSAVSVLKKYTDYVCGFDVKRTQYYHVEKNLPEGTRIIFASEFEYHELPRLAKIGKTTLYCTDDTKGKVVLKTKECESVEFQLPPNDLVIEDSSKLKIVKITSSQSLYLQRIFIKKVDKVTAPRYPYIVMYGDYLLGGFGFEYPKNEEYDMWLLSDYCTNNAIPRLAKLILLCILSNPIKRALSRKVMRNVESCYTKVYTHNPVSMKYRGIFKKVSQEPSHLVYDAILGSSGNMEDVIKKYKEIRDRK
ncbi:MAG: amidoligase family protein [Paludibacteraceae bacterium]|nr:amidoligase family protein [Paludibacteraceae bacterium]